MGVMAWVLITHSLIPNPASLVHGLGAPIFFNVLLFIMIYLGLKALERERGDRSTFKEALKTGVKISFVYAFTASLFFAGVLMVIGTRWLETEPGVRQGPPSQAVPGHGGSDPAAGRSIGRDRLATGIGKGVR